MVLARELLVIRKIKCSRGNQVSQSLARLCISSNQASCKSKRQNFGEEDTP